MYKILGVGLLGVFAMMLIPGSVASDSNEITLYGAATLVKHDALGNPVFSQIIHNQLVDEGEDTILAAVFNEGTAAEATATSFGAICVGDIVITEDDNPTASSFDTTIEGGGLSDNDNCESLADGGVGTASGVATIGPLTFDEGAANAGNVDTDDVILNIAICQSTAGAAADMVDCETGGSGTGVMLAFVDTSDVTLASGDTVDITYTFDISDAAT